MSENQDSRIILKLNEKQRQMVEEGLADYERGDFLTTEEMFKDLLDDED